MFGRDRWKIGLKWEKGSISLGIEGEFLQFFPETSEHLLYTFLMPDLLLLSQKFWTKLKKIVLSDQFYTVLSTLDSPSPKLWAKFVILLYCTIRLGVNLD